MNRIKKRQAVRVWDFRRRVTKYKMEQESGAFGLIFSKMCWYESKFNISVHILEAFFREESSRGKLVLHSAQAQMLKKGVLPLNQKRFRKTDSKASISKNGRYRNFS